MRRIACFSILVMVGCGGQLVGVDEGSDEQSPGALAAESAVVGGKAQVTASALNLRSGASTSASILLVMPHGAIVDVLGVSGTWYDVDYQGTKGWCAGQYLTPIASGGGSTATGGGGTAVDDAIARAKSGVGFSYHWGGGCWDPNSSSHGACYGSCPGCTHSGTWGADCSGYVAKVWQVPGASALTSCEHPYSTWNFYNTHDHWSDVSRAGAKRGDAFVYNAAGAGHIFLYESGDAWGWITSYECRGCAAGCVHNTRTADSSYKAIRRNGY